jgi:hypothetical protein
MLSEYKENLNNPGALRFLAIGDALGDRASLSTEYMRRRNGIRELRTTSRLTLNCRQTVSRVSGDTRPIKENCWIPEK